MTDIWRELGIGRDSDERDIRRAYARRLKQTHPEDDPEGFRVLRDAYEAALAYAAGSRFDAEEEPADGDDVLVAPEPESPRVTVRAVAPDPARTVEAETVEADAIAAAEQAARAEQQALLAALEEGRTDESADRFARLLASPLADNLRFRDMLERWTADVIVHHLPRSDVLVDPAIAAFRWNTDQYRDLPQSVGTVLAWAEDRKWISAAAAPDGDLGLGWQALTAAPAAPWRMRLAALRPGTTGQALHLLGIANWSFPILRAYFEPARVAWWQTFLSRGRLSLGSFGLWLVGLSLFVATLEALTELGTEEWVIGLATIPCLLATLAAPFVYARYIKRAPVAGVDVTMPPQWRDLSLVAPLALPLVAIVLPGTALATLALMVGAILAVAAVAWYNPVPPSTLRFGPRITRIAKNYWLVGLYLFFHLPVISATRITGLLAVILGLAISWHRGGRRALQLYAGRDERRRSAAVVAILAALAASGVAMALTEPTGEGSYDALLCSLPCLGLMLLLSGTAREGWLQGLIAVSYLAIVALWIAAIGTAPDTRPRPGTSVPLEAVPPQTSTLPPQTSTLPQPTFDLPTTQPPDFEPPIRVEARPKPKPWVAPLCPTMAPDATGPSAVLPCGGDRWIRSEDYPSAALRRGAAGKVRAETMVGTEGRITECTVPETSGDSDLDQGTCRLLRERARFVPARDETGAPVPAKFVFTMTWQISK